MINKNKGFTLIELLIVIGIISVLAVAVVVVINPAELLAQARDSTRLSDLASINSAIGLYMVDTGNPTFGEGPNCTATDCDGDHSDDSWGDLSSGGEDYTFNSSATVGGNDSDLGWVEVDFGSMSTGSPLPRLPLDPSNSGAFFYAYAADNSDNTFELNANMESRKFGGNSSASNGRCGDTADSVVDTDGGNAECLFEVGTDLTLMGGLNSD